ncbi:7437_t:CDS:2 [Paraglomus occultum]|uniref:7437_t:CDS:1 n=1 Tax=Paraglomus occultum TaxID=144539 RepID=A0A9N9GMV8_9GLOM|nr:7437_t:CDS:2 [Paraglomus occultum]
MDFIVQLPPTRLGHDAIVVFVDRLTKRAYFQPTHTTVTAPEVAKLFFSTIFKNHRLPKVIISDRDAKFTSNFWKLLFNHIGTKLAMFTAFHPQTDGQTERMNHTLEEMLRAYSIYKQNTWDEYLPAVKFAYNNSKQASTGFTPFELDCGQHPNTPASLASNKLNHVLAAEDFINHWNNMIKIAKDTLIPTRKLSPKYLGPYTISAKISSTSYRLDLPSTLKIHPVFHVSMLKPYQQFEEFNREAPPQPIIIPESNEAKYEVEQILDKRLIRNKTQYLVKWLCYPLHDATWEPVENLKNAPKKLKEFELMRK